MTEQRAVPIPDEAKEAIAAKNWAVYSKHPDLAAVDGVGLAAPHIDRAARTALLDELIDHFEMHPVQRWTGREIVAVLRNELEADE